MMPMMQPAMRFSNDYAIKDCCTLALNITQGDISRTMTPRDNLSGLHVDEIDFRSCAAKGIPSLHAPPRCV